jgi:hypothetical protein
MSEAWWKGSSSSWTTNKVLKRVHRLMFWNSAIVAVLAYYVCSECGPAGKSSCHGALGRAIGRLLPRVDLGPNLGGFPSDCDDANKRLVRPMRGRRAELKVINAEQSGWDDLVSARGDRAELDFVEFLSSWDI